MPKKVNVLYASKTVHSPFHWLLLQFILTTDTLAVVVQTVSEQDIKLQPLWHEDNGPGSRHQGQDRNQGQNR